MENNKYWSAEVTKDKDHVAIMVSQELATEEELEIWMKVTKAAKVVWTYPRKDQNEPT